MMLRIRSTGRRVALAAAAGLFLAGCGAPGALDATAAAGLQASVREVARLAAAGDEQGAAARAEALREEVESASGAGKVSEDRAALISARIDAVLAALEGTGASPSPAASTPPPSTAPPGSQIPDPASAEPAVPPPAPEPSAGEPQPSEPAVDEPEVPEPGVQEPAPAEPEPATAAPGPEPVTAAPEEPGKGNGNSGGEKGNDKPGKGKSDEPKKNG